MLKKQLSSAVDIFRISNSYNTELISKFEEKFMPGGHASHKGGGTKHSHDNSQIDSAANLVGDPENLLDEQGTEINPAATERPDETATKQQKQEQ
jgi:hypothetical protein